MGPIYIGVVGPIYIGDKAISALGSNVECATVTAITTAHGICHDSEPTKAAARVVPIHTEWLEAHDGIGVCRHTQLAPPDLQAFIQHQR